MTIAQVKERIVNASRMTVFDDRSDGAFQMKAVIMRRIEDQSQRTYERSMVKSLRAVYQPLSSSLQAGLKRETLGIIAAMAPRSVVNEIAASLQIFFKKALALSFSLLMISSLALTPWSSLNSPEIVPAVKAAYLACTGTVFVNGALCNPESLVKVNPGDAISTDHYSEATLVYSDSTLVRFEKTTVASINPSGFGQIHVQQGAVWLNAMGTGAQDSFRLTTPIVKVRVPQGSAGIATNGNTTQLFTTNGVVEVQIDHKKGVTELLALAPEKKMVVRQNRARTQVHETGLDQKSLVNSRDNTLKDREYLRIVRKKFPELFESSSQVASLMTNHELASVNLTKKLLSAHMAMSSGDTTLAQSTLQDAFYLVESSPLSSDRMVRTDLAILDDIAKNSPSLKNLASDMRGKMVDQIRMLSLQKKPSEMVGNSVSGTAL